MEHFLEQAEFCTQIWNLDVEYRMMDAHQLAAQPLDLLVALVRGVALQRRRRKWSRQCRTVAAVTRPRAPGCRPAPRAAGAGALPSSGAPRTGPAPARRQGRAAPLRA
jgi:hypothetical protein